MSSYDQQQGSEVRSFDIVPPQEPCAHSIFFYIGTRERHLESLLQSSLSRIILVKNFPRSLIQIVLQIEDTPANDYVTPKLVQAGTVRDVLFSLSEVNRA